METKTEIIFLGTGTSIGVPVIGCDCEVCLSEDPKNKRLRSSLFVTTPEVRFVVDTGPDFRQQCLREGIRHLDAALFTHAHSDHVMGFDDLRRFTVREHEELPIFANGECLDRLEAAFPYIFDGENRYRGYLKIAPHRISGPFPLGDLLVTPLPVIHGKVETNGFLFSRNDQKVFAYIPDAKILTAETKSHLAGIDLLVLDGLQPERHQTHLSISESLALIKELEIKQAWLTHFSCRMNYKTLEPTLPQRVSLAWDGLKICL